MYHQFRMIPIKMIRQRVCLLHVSDRKTVGVISIIRHKTEIVFPSARIFIFYVRDHLINSVGCLGNSTYGETSDTDVYLLFINLLPVICIIQKAEIIVHDIRILIQRLFRLIRQQHIAHIHRFPSGSQFTVVERAITEQQ